MSISDKIKAGENKVLSSNELLVMKNDVAAHMRGILKAMHFDLNDPNLTDTGERIARMFVDEIFSGSFSEPPKCTTFPCNEGVQPDMVFLGNIDLFSTCSHHFKSFAGKAHIAYLPNQKLLGISKLARITDWFARRPQLQEGLTAQIADYIMGPPWVSDNLKMTADIKPDALNLHPKGVAVHIEAVHNCMRVRGAEQTSSVMSTTALRGCFLNDKSMADEFFMKIARLQ